MSVGIDPTVLSGERVECLCRKFLSFCVVNPTHVRGKGVPRFVG